MKTWALVVLLLLPAGLAAAKRHAPAVARQAEADSPPETPVATNPPADPSAAKLRALHSLPLDKGLPLIVRAGLAYIQVHEVNENKGTFTATVDMRLRWEDLRLRYPKEETPRGFYEFRSNEAEAKLAEIWTPTVRLLNIAEGAPLQSTGLRIFPDGVVEQIIRTRTTFKSDFDATRFPFDKQSLVVQLSSDKEGMKHVVFQFLQSDLSFSRTFEGVVIDGWTIGTVSLSKLVTAGWYGEFYSGVTVGLAIRRQAIKMVAPIFIPLLASLLIPLVAIWMNGVKDGEFTVEAFELGNVIIGGLFAVIALNYSINSTYSMIASGDNTVIRLFALNYVALATSLGIVVFLYRFNVPRRFFGQYFQEALFRYLTWSVPAIAFGSAAAIVIAAMY